MVESRKRRQVEDALGLIGGGIVHARATPASGRLLLQRGQARQKPHFGEAQEDEAENGLRILCGGQAGIGAELISRRQRRFSNAWASVSCSLGAIHCIRFPLQPAKCETDACIAGNPSREDASTKRSGGNRLGIIRLT